MVPVAVIDLFAGPGGLGEGFSASDAGAGYRLALSIEKDPAAHNTLKLRAFFRQFPKGEVPADYYELLRGGLTIDELYRKHQRQARRAAEEAWCQELGPESAASIRDRIALTLGRNDRWLLIGGPPCQAYSLAGRSRNKGKEEYDPATDRRQTLYVEYLQILADHAPPVFVMENVKGMLSATLESELLFARIRGDLEDPARALAREKRLTGDRKPRYRIYSLAGVDDLFGSRSADFVLRAERYGVPQARHRVIIVGVREDVGKDPDILRFARRQVTVETVLAGLPRVRSGLSRGDDSHDSWLAAIRGAKNTPWFKWLGTHGLRDVQKRVRQTIEGLSRPRKARGGEFVEADVSIGEHREWYLDNRIGGCINHRARGHMIEDLHRYLFAACFAQERDSSPGLGRFPPSLLPDHANVDRALDGNLFTDRFRVQVATRPSTTITSHIHKDGHYYIHYDPTQCRSLTVREAARLQTFPDNYLFVGGRTAQYLQVGNAVPPLLARQIADLIAHIFA